MQFGVGEALALAFAGPPVPVDLLLRSNFVSLALQYNIYRSVPPLRPAARCLVSDCIWNTLWARCREM